MTAARGTCLCLTPASPAIRMGVPHCTRCTHKIVPRKKSADLSDHKKETTFKVEFSPPALTDQLVLRIGTQSIAIPAFRRDDHDFETMTALKAIDFDPTRGEITLRYTPLEERL